MPKRPVAYFQRALPLAQQAKDYQAIRDLSTRLFRLTRPATGAPSAAPPAPVQASQIPPKRQAITVVRTGRERRGLQLSSREDEQYISFGDGAYSCLGIHLARLEMRVLLNAMLDRLPGSRRDLAAEDPHIHRLIFRSSRTCRHAIMSNLVGLRLNRSVAYHPRRDRTTGREAVGMSEYQYYEFLALDRPLTEKQRAELRSISTRAEITATRFVNEYQWGDLKGDPRQMVERYFDAFLYLANWGTRRLMFRLPRGVLDAETAGQYCYTDTASLIETGSHLILSLYVDREPDDYWDEPGGQLAAMVQARSELAAGDLRLLYLAWLLALNRMRWTTRIPSRRCRRPGDPERSRFRRSPIS